MQGVEGTGGDDGDGGGVALDAGISTVAGGRWAAGCKDGEVEANDAVLRESGAVTVVANLVAAARRAAVAAAPASAPVPAAHWHGHGQLCGAGYGRRRCARRQGRANG